MWTAIVTANKRRADMACAASQVSPEHSERLHAAADAQSDESRTLYHLPHMQVGARALRVS